jgi:NAD(P)-dependent dehydrogenase (short-subunit alcohol dehydrogenase family)
MLRREGGAVVNVGSVAGVNANRGSLTHSVTKAALAQMTRVMANDIAAAVLYLSSPAAAWVTGKLIEVDGGALGAVLSNELPDL